MIKLLIFVLFLVGVSVNVNAKKLNQAQKSAAKNLSAVTVFVDITSISRKKLAASKMTKLHQQFALEGYELIDVETYNENGDLEGFFVSYKKIKP